ncbi:MAG: twin-arginine translocase subunit TatB [Actinomycetia bacterium]|nr:twin-arginine translocase subunit TatB [Actinomycetes bacterium]MCP4224807.1 twin-arginine translocase subunit TatB [Actinomycetes bacterium]MCP5033458.1 twin-arginine translocase subunit TatB [Actinomycetes bacterium]
MFFNVGGLEILVIAMVALIAVGPEQLPSVLRKVGAFVAQARSMTTGLRDEFMSGLDEVTEIADPKKWMGTGSDDDPIVHRGYAKTQPNGSGTTDSSEGTTDGSEAAVVEEAEEVAALETGDDGPRVDGEDNV